MGEFTFWTLMLWLVLLKIKLARIALAKRRAWIWIVNTNAKRKNTQWFWEVGVHTWVEISSWSSLGKLTKWSYLVPTRNGMAVLLKPRPCLYHSLMEFNVLFLVRSNIKSMATASLQTKGSMFTNSRWPPRSQMEKVISVFRIEMVFSMKLTPERVIRQWPMDSSSSFSYPESVYNPHPSYPRRT